MLTQKGETILLPSQKKCINDCVRPFHFSVRWITSLKCNYSLELICWSQLHLPRRHPQRKTKVMRSHLSSWSLKSPRWPPDYPGFWGSSANNHFDLSISPRNSESCETHFFPELKVKSSNRVQNPEILIRSQRTNVHARGIKTSQGSLSVFGLLCGKTAEMINPFSSGSTCSINF